MYTLKSINTTHLPIHWENFSLIFQDTIYRHIRIIFLSRECYYIRKSNHMTCWCYPVLYSWCLGLQDDENQEKHLKNYKK